MPLRDLLAHVRSFALGALGDDVEEVIIRLRSGKQLVVPVLPWPPPGEWPGAPVSPPPAPAAPPPPAPRPPEPAPAPPPPAPIPEPALMPGNGPEFTPNDYQIEILVALENGPLKTDALAAKTTHDRRMLFTPGGIYGLQNAGLVRHKKRIGYYRTDSPPEELTGSGAGPVA